MTRLALAFLLVCTSAWGQDVDALLVAMSIEEKIGQLIIPAVYSNQPDSDLEGHLAPCIEDAEDLLLNYHVGGLLLKRRWAPDIQRHLVDHFRHLAQKPLWITQDLEYGLAMRHPVESPLPKQMTLGAIEDLALVRRAGAEIGAQCRSVGVDVNFAPIVDVNSNWRNPVIHMRAFGDDPEEVGNKAIALMTGMTSQGVLTCAKHFPGHGDTHIDSHDALPVIDKSLMELSKVELLPFQRMIDGGVPMVMIAHLSLPQIDSNGTPTSASKKIVHNLLREQMKYKGLIITDGLQMGALKKLDMPTFCLQALQAGVDLLLEPPEPRFIIRRLIQAVRSGELSEALVDDKVRRILQAKTHRQSPQPHSVDVALIQQLYHAALTRVGSNHSVITATDTVLIQVGGYDQTVLKQQLEGAVKGIEYLSAIPTQREITSLSDRLKSAPHIVLALFPAALPKKRFGVSESTVQLIEMLQRQGKRVTVALMTSPYALKFFREEMDVIVGYESNEYAQRAVAEVLQGAEAKGRLPVRVTRAPTGARVGLTQA